MLKKCRRKFEAESKAVEVARANERVSGSLSERPQWRARPNRRYIATNYALLNENKIETIEKKHRQTFVQSKSEYEEAFNQQA